MVLSFTNFHLTIESAQNFRTNFIIKKFHKVYLHIILSFKAQENKQINKYAHTGVSYGPSSFFPFYFKIYNNYQKYQKIPNKDETYPNMTKLYQKITK